MSVVESSAHTTPPENDASESFKLSRIPPASYPTLVFVILAYVFMMVVVFNPMSLSLYAVCGLLILTQILLVFGILDLYSRV